MYRQPLIPAGFEPPRELSLGDCRLRPLDHEVMLADYDAVVRGAEAIAGAYRREPRYYREFSLADEVIELGWHVGEWRRRRSFAYAVMSPDGARCFGSVYVYPTLKRDHDAEVILWTTPDAPGPGFEARLLAAVRAWLAEAWPLRSVAFPGRDIPWAEWDALPEGG